MARNLTMETGRRAFNEIATGTSPAALERFKLERLFELRAVIDALRSEQPAGASDEAFARNLRSRQ
jgi:hypothetical protein